jgi:predicted DCC family thiol-disulfide oxidoreductase YuxK
MSWFNTFFITENELMKKDLELAAVQGEAAGLRYKIKDLERRNKDLTDSHRLIENGSSFEKVKAKLETLRLKNLTIEYVEGVQHLQLSDCATCVRFSGDFYL